MSEDDKFGKFYNVYQRENDGRLEELWVARSTLSEEAQSALQQVLIERAKTTNAGAEQKLNDDKPIYVVVRDIDMSIGAMCRFMVKWAVASIPAAIILVILYFICALLAYGCGRTIFH